MKKVKIIWNKTSFLILPLILAVIIAILWETKALNVIMGAPQQILPTPSNIFRVLGENLTKMSSDIQTTLFEIFLGLLIGSILGYLLAVLTALSPVVGKGGIALITMFNAIPIIALTPVVLNLTKLGGGTVDQRSFTAKVIVVTLVTMSSMSITSYRGLTELKPFAKDLLDSYAAPKSVEFFKLRLPNSIPYIFTALQIGVPTAVISALVSEYFTESTLGVGYKIKSNFTNAQFTSGWAYIFIGCFIGIILYILVMIIKTIVLRNRRR